MLSYTFTWDGDTPSTVIQWLPPTLSIWTNGSSVTGKDRSSPSLVSYNPERAGNWLFNIWHAVSTCWSSSQQPVLIAVSDSTDSSGSFFFLSFPCFFLDCSSLCCSFCFLFSGYHSFRGFSILVMVHPDSSSLQVVKSCQLERDDFFGWQWLEQSTLADRQEHQPLLPSPR